MTDRFVKDESPKGAWVCHLEEDGTVLCLCSRGYVKPIEGNQCPVCARKGGREVGRVFLNKMFPNQDPDTIMIKWPKI